MRHDRRHTAHRARGASIEKLAIDAVGETALLQEDNDRALRLGGGCQRHIGETVSAPWSREIDIAFGDGGVTLANLLHELQKRTAEGKQVGKFLAQQQAYAHVEELLRSLIGVEQLTTDANDQDRHRQGSSHGAAEVGWFLVSRAEFRSCAHGFNHLCPHAYLL